MTALYSVKNPALRLLCENSVAKYVRRIGSVIQISMNIHGKSVYFFLNRRSVVSSQAGSIVFSQINLVHF